MLKKIYQELVAIRKELQAIRISLEPKTYSFSTRMKGSCTTAIKDAKIQSLRAEREKLNQFIDEIING